MKKLFLLISTLISISVFGQFPNSFGISNSQTQYYVKGGMGADSSFIFRTAYADTTAANRGWQDAIPGCVIRTIGGYMWVRNDAATAWILISQGTGGGTPVDTTTWRVSGTGQTIVNSISGGGIGTANIVPLWLITSGAIRIQIPAGGITRQTAARYKTMLYDTIDHNLGYGDAGSGSTPTWQQTLTAGSTLTGNNTVDGGGFDFKLYSAAGNILFNTKANSTSYGSRLYLNGDSAWYVGNNRAYVKSNGVGNKLHIVAGQTSSDTTTYKPLAAQSSDGETVLMTYWPGGGGSGTVTNFSATDGNGFDFTVTNPTTTPTLTATTTVGDTRLMYSSSGAITGHENYTLSTNASYPSITIGAAGAISSYLALRDPAGTLNYLSTDGGPFGIYGSSTYGLVTIRSLKNNLTAFNIEMNNAGYNQIGVDGIMANGDTTHLSLYQGCYDINRTFGYQIGGVNPHGYTDQTIFKRSNNSFNSFGTFVHFGNNSATAMNHYAGFQNVITKDSSNTTTDVFGFLNAIGQITGGNITNWYGYYHYDQDTAGGTITNQYGVYVPTLTAATNNYGAYFGSNVGIGTTTPSTPLHIVKTTEQARIGYDGSNYYKTTVGSTGGVTFDAVGSGANFTFSDAVTLGNLPSGAVSDSVLTDASGAVRHRKVSDLISPYVTTGTYTPTLSNTTNVSASTAYQCQYSVAADASGNQVVTVSGEVDIDPTTTVTLTVLRVTLPIASNVGQTYEIGGTANDELGTPARISGNVANDVAEIRFTPVDVTNRTFSFVFVYKVNIP